jgi:hypothetical protein
MKKNWKMGWFALILVFLVQLACASFTEIAPETFCEMRGGKFIKGEISFDDVCVMPRTATPASQMENKTEVAPSNPPVSPLASATGEYLTPTPASAQDCNATAYIQTQIEIVKTTQEQYYRECEYKLVVTNAHPSDGIWALRHTNTSVHSPALDSENSYWYSDLIVPGQLWEKQFRSSYYTDGQFSREGVDMVAGVFNLPDCLYLLKSADVELISQPVEWACGP